MCTGDNVKAKLSTPRTFLPKTLTLTHQLVEATFLALGLLTYCLRDGFLMYPQRHGCCAFSLLQQALDGGEDEMSAGEQGASSPGLHVTASAVRLSPENSTTASATTHKATKETLFIIFSPTQAANTKKAKKLNGIGCILGDDLRHNL
ncbi:hypothetical protein Gotur_013116 [Gossypium turneri]